MKELLGCNLLLVLSEAGNSTLMISGDQYLMTTLQGSVKRGSCLMLLMPFCVINRNYARQNFANIQLKWVSCLPSRNKRDTIAHALHTVTEIVYDVTTLSKIFHNPLTRQRLTTEIPIWTLLCYSSGDTTLDKIHSEFICHFLHTPTVRNNWTYSLSALDAFNTCMCYLTL